MNDQVVKTISSILLALLLFPKLVFGESAQFGYRVTQTGKTVIQIARDVYNDERQWKKIAYWNNLNPPYALSVGQILTLPLAPKVPVAEKNLVTGADVPAPQFAPALPSVSRVIYNRKGYYVYEVNERAPSLSMVALENYGDKSMIKLIARWNGISADDRLSLGQKLILHEKPKLSAQKANHVLSKEWARVGNLAMVQRINGAVSVSNYQTAAQAPVTSGKKPASVTSTEPPSYELPKQQVPEVPAVETNATPEVVQLPTTPAPTVEVPAATSLPPASLPQIPEPSTVSLPTLPAVPSPALPAEPTNAPESTPQGSKKLPEKKGQTVVTEPASLGQPLNVMETTTPNVFQPNDDPELQPQINPQADTPVEPAALQPNTPAFVAPAQTAQPQATIQPQAAVETPTPTAVRQIIPQTPPPVQPQAADQQTPVHVSPIPQPQVQAPSEEPKREIAATPTDPLQLPEPTTDSYWLGSDTVRIMKTLTKPQGK